jgi:hypothetical protein
MPTVARSVLAMSFGTIETHQSLECFTSWLKISLELEDTMAERQPNLVISSLSGPVTRDDVTVEVDIYRLEHETTWSLEVVNGAGTSIVWDDQFPSDSDAYQEFLRTVAEEGMQAFLDKGNVIPFPR